MKLLMKSVLRHVKQHMLQTLLTLFSTVLIVALLSTVFCFVSSFQMLLREYALETVGSYHYWYKVPKEDFMEEMLWQAAEEFEEDDFFSEVLLEEFEETVSLKLTVASPGIFTTKTMEKKMWKYQNEFLEAYRQQHLSEAFYFRMTSRHNFELLVSYGDLHKDNGIYSLLLIFFLMIAVIAAVAALTLGQYFVFLQYRESGILRFL